MFVHSLAGISATGVDEESTSIVRPPGAVFGRLHGCHDEAREGLANRKGFDLVCHPSFYRAWSEA